jgi:hypothetical protein
MYIASMALVGYTGRFVSLIHIRFSFCWIDHKTFGCAFWRFLAPSSPAGTYVCWGRGLSCTMLNFWTGCLSLGVDGRPTGVFIYLLGNKCVCVGESVA